MATISDSLLLPDRAAVPAEIAYLRARFPVGEWHGHPNYGQLAAFWLHIHEHLRMSAAHLRQTFATFHGSPSAPADFGRQFSLGLRTFYEHLNGHHEIEDHAYFPKFRLIDPRMARAFDMLESDHAIIHQGITESVTSARRLLGSLDQGGDPLRFAADAYARDSEQLLKLLIRHLADEEEIVIPAMLEHGERAVT